MGFKKWLSTEYPKIIDPPDQEDLTLLVVEYLTTSRNGRLIDPVARFHLGNGATLLRINHNADMSEQGQRQSFGYMVNYSYELESIVRNHEELMESGKIAMSKDVETLFKKTLAFRKEVINA